MSRRTKAGRRRSFRRWADSMPGMGLFARAWRNLRLIELTEDFGDAGPCGELAKMRSLLVGLQRACAGRPMPPHGPLVTLTADDDLALEWGWPGGRVTVVAGRGGRDAPPWTVYWRLGDSRGQLARSAEPPVDRITSLVCPRCP